MNLKNNNLGTINACNKITYEINREYEMNGKYEKAENDLFSLLS